MTDLLGIAREVASGARTGEQVEAYVVHGRTTEVRALNGDVESLTAAEEQGIGIRVIVEGRQGLAWAGSLDRDVVEDTLREARDNAAFGSPDENYGVATPDDVAAVSPPVLELWRDSLATVTTEAKVALTLDCDARSRSLDERVRGVESVDYGDSLTEAAIANSAGVEATSRRTSCSVSSSVIAREGDATQTGYGFSAGRAFDALDGEVAARDAVARSTRLLGAGPVPSERIPVVFDPLVTRSLLRILSSGLNAESVLKGRSMFADRVGEAIATERLTLVEDPTIPEAFGAATHDSEGIPTRRVELVVDGVLQGFLHNLYTARRAGSATTASAVRGISSSPGVGARALHCEPGAMTPAEVLASVPRAFYVQSVSGIHSGVNPISGDFSVGAEGLMVHDGSFAEPVREVTIASTLPRMLLAVSAIGNDLVWLPGGGAGLTLMIGEMQLSGS